MRKLYLKLLTIVFLVTAASAAPKSIFLVGTTLTTATTGGFSIIFTQEIAQQFVLDVNGKSTSITFAVTGSWESNATAGSDVPFLAQLTNGIGPGSIVLAQQQFTFVAQPNLYATTFSFSGAKKLPPGTYYLVLSTMGTADIGFLSWAPQGEINSPFGHIGSAYCADPTGYANPNEAAFSPCTTPQTMQFQLIGK
jgi:hypothetical protein